MSQMSNYLENKLVDWLLRGQSLPTISNLYIGLHTADPTDAGTGAEVSTSGTGYARQAIAASLNNFCGTQGTGTTTASSGTSGASSNNVAVNFSAATSGWGTVTHVGIWDASTGGNLLFYGSLTVSKTVTTGDPFVFSINALTITLA